MKLWRSCLSRSPAEHWTLYPLLARSIAGSRVGPIRVSSHLQGINELQGLKCGLSENTEITNLVSLYHTLAPWDTNATHRARSSLFNCNFLLVMSFPTCYVLGYFHSQLPQQNLKSPLRSGGLSDRPKQGSVADSNCGPAPS